MKSNSQVILALDSSDMPRTMEMIEATKEHIGIYKLGLEFYLVLTKSPYSRLRCNSYFLLTVTK
jgi:orotidine-5'-phosphate decarboxylase